jgi:hypothetical protein
VRPTASSAEWTCKGDPCGDEGVGQPALVGLCPPQDERAPLVLIHHDDRGGAFRHGPGDGGEHVGAVVQPGRQTCEQGRQVALAGRAWGGVERPCEADPVAAGPVVVAPHGHALGVTRHHREPEPDVEGHGGAVAGAGDGPDGPGAVALGVAEEAPVERAAQAGPPQRGVDTDEVNVGGFRFGRGQEADEEGHEAAVGPLDHVAGGGEVLEEQSWQQGRPLAGPGVPAAVCPPVVEHGEDPAVVGLGGAADPEVVEPGEHARSLAAARRATAVR